MDWILHQIEQMDVPTLLVIAGMFWLFKSHLDKKFEKIDQRFEKIDQRFEKVDSKIDKVEERLNKRIDHVDEKLTDIDRRLCRLEGAFSNKECCMIRDHRVNEKAE